jgi:hypothetical protein
VIRYLPSPIVAIGVVVLTPCSFWQVLNRRIGIVDDIGCYSPSRRHNQSNEESQKSIHCTDEGCDARAVGAIYVNGTTASYRPGPFSRSRVRQRRGPVGVGSISA